MKSARPDPVWDVGIVDATGGESGQALHDELARRGLRVKRHRVQGPEPTPAVLEDAPKAVLCVALAAVQGVTVYALMPAALYQGQAAMFAAVGRKAAPGEVEVGVLGPELAGRIVERVGRGAG